MMALRKGGVGIGETVKGAEEGPLEIVPVTNLPTLIGVRMRCFDFAEDAREGTDEVREGAFVVLLSSTRAEACFGGEHGLRHGFAGVGETVEDAEEGELEVIPIADLPAFFDFVGFVVLAFFGRDDDGFDRPDEVRDVAEVDEGEKHDFGSLFVFSQLLGSLASFFFAEGAELRSCVEDEVESGVGVRVLGEHALRELE
jgi:hypothetical protein